MSQKTTKNPRKRGAPLGNTNRLIHGMYSKQHPIEDNPAMTHEIATLRQVNRHLIDCVPACKDINQLIALYDLIGKTSSRIAHLIRSNITTTSQTAENDLNHTLTTTLEDLYRDLDLKETYSNLPG